jgi:hypothetical protein
VKPDSDSKELKHEVVSIPPPGGAAERLSVATAPPVPAPFRWLLILVGFSLFIRFGPVAFCSLDAPGYFGGKLTSVSSLVHGSGRDMLTLIEPERFYGKSVSSAKRFRTGSERFDHEWFFGTFMMSVTGTAQVIAEHPELRADARDVLGLGLKTISEKSTRSFDTKAWGEDAFEGTRDHCGFLCYWLFAINRARLVEPQMDADELKTADRVLARLEASLNEHGILETYPNEFFPVDNSLFVGALGLHTQATGISHAEAIEKFEKTVRTQWLDPSGYLVQAVDQKGVPRDRARGSGTALASFALAQGAPALSRDLWLSLRKHGFKSVLGFGGVREYPTASGPGDVDSGPVIFGLGVSASGFAMGAARSHGDEAAFNALYASAHFMGVPVDGDKRRNFVTGGPIGQAILFAMLTAPKARVP